MRVGCVEELLVEIMGNRVFLLDTGGFCRLPCPPGKSLVIGRGSSIWCNMLEVSVYLWGKGLRHEEGAGVASSPEES